MSRATWPPEDQAWLDANPRGLPPDTPYRPGHLMPPAQKDTGRREPDPWLSLRDEAALAGATGAVLASTWLRREFGGQPMTPEEEPAAKEPERLKEAFRKGWGCCRVAILDKLQGSRLDTAVLAEIERSLEDLGEPKLLIHGGTTVITSDEARRISADGP